MLVEGRTGCAGHRVSGGEGGEDMSLVVSVALMTEEAGCDGRRVSGGGVETSLAALVALVTEEAESV